MEKKKKMMRREDRSFRRQGTIPFKWEIKPGIPKCKTAPPPPQPPPPPPKLRPPPSSMIALSVSSPSSGVSVAGFGCFFVRLTSGKR